MSHFFKHVTQWSIPTILDTVTKASVVALGAYLLQKHEFGIITLAMLIFAYHPMLQFGITDGLIIKLPGWFAKGNLEEMHLSLGASLSYTVIAISAMIILIILFSFALDLDKTFSLSD